MKVNSIVHQKVVAENSKLKKEIDKLLVSIKRGSRKTNLAAVIVNRFYKIKPLLIERKGAFRFDKWQEISTLINLTDRFSSINKDNQGSELKMSKL